MARNTEIFVTLRDRVSQPMNTIATSGKRLNKDLDDVNSTMSNMMRRQDVLKEGLAKTQVSFSSLSEELRQAKKAYKDLNNEQNRTNLEDIQRKYNDTRDTITDYRRTIRETGREIRDLDDQRQKMSNRVADDGPLTAGSGLLSELSKAGLGNMLGTSISGLGGSMVASAYGDLVGQQMESVLSGVVSGAAMGSVMGPAGGFIGAGVGLTSGLLNAKAQEFEAEDDYSKATRNERIENVLSQRETDIEAGSASAASREMAIKSVSGVLGDDAEHFINELVRRDAENPFSFEDMMSLSNTYFGFGLTTDEIFTQLDNMGNLGVARQLGSQDLGQVGKVIARMKTSPTLKKTDLEQLIERGISAQTYIADAYDIAERDVWENLSDFNPQEIYEIITDYMMSDPQFMGQLASASDTFSGKQDMLEAAELEGSIAYGDGYKQVRGLGVDQRTDYLEEHAEIISAENRALGEYQASLENLEWKIEEDIMALVRSQDKALAGSLNTMNPNFDLGTYEQALELQKEYQDALKNEDNAELWRVLAEAKILAESAYMASEGYQQNVEMQKTLVQNVTQTMKDDKTYWNAGYELQLEFNKGMADAFEFPLLPTDWRENLSLTNGLEGTVFGQFVRGREQNKEGSRAIGARYIPKDGLYEVHEGEEITTAREVRANKGATAPAPIQVSVTGNSFRDREDIDYMVETLVEKLTQTQGTM